MIITRSVKVLVCSKLRNASRFDLAKKFPSLQVLVLKSHDWIIITNIYLFRLDIYTT